MSMDYIEQEKKRYEEPEGYTQKEVDRLMAVSWKQGFEAGAASFAKKHKNFMMIFSNN